jgi:hypothetical protein
MEPHDHCCDYKKTAMGRYIIPFNIILRRNFISMKLIFIRKCCHSTTVTLFYPFHVSTCVSIFLSLKSTLNLTLV